MEEVLLARLKCFAILFFAVAHLVRIFHAKMRVQPIVADEVANLRARFVERAEGRPTWHIKKKKKVAVVCRTTYPQQCSGTFGLTYVLIVHNYRKKNINRSIRRLSRQMNGIFEERFFVCCTGHRRPSSVHRIRCEQREHRRTPSNSQLTLPLVAGVIRTR